MNTGPREGATEGGRGREIAREAAVFSQPKLRRKKDVRERERNESDGWIKERTGNSIGKGEVVPFHHHLSSFRL